MSRTAARGDGAFAPGIIEPPKGGDTGRVILLEAVGGSGSTAPRWRLPAGVGKGSEAWVTSPVVAVGGADVLGRRGGGGTGGFSPCPFCDIFNRLFFPQKFFFHRTKQRIYISRSSSSFRLKNVVSWPQRQAHVSWSLKNACSDQG